MNQLRVEQVKRLLLDPTKANQSVLGLAFEPGFNSKSTFNAIFKRATGYSPGAFRKLNPFPLVSQEARTSSPRGGTTGSTLLCKNGPSFHEKQNLKNQEGKQNMRILLAVVCVLSVAAAVAGASQFEPAKLLEGKLMPNTRGWEQ